MGVRFRFQVLFVFVIFQLSHEEPITKDQILQVQIKTEDLIQKILQMVRNYYYEKKITYKCLPEQVPDQIIEILKNSIDCVEGNEKLYDKNKVLRRDYEKNFVTCFLIAKREVKDVLDAINTTINYCPTVMKEKTYVINVTTYYTSTFRLNIQNGLELYQKDIQKTRKELPCPKQYLKDERHMTNSDESEEAEDDEEYDIKTIQHLKGLYNNTSMRSKFIKNETRKMTESSFENRKRVSQDNNDESELDAKSFRFENEDNNKKKEENNSSAVTPSKEPDSTWLTAETTTTTETTIEVLKKRSNEDEDFTRPYVGKTKGKRHVKAVDSKSVAAKNIRKRHENEGFKGEEVTRKENTETSKHEKLWKRQTFDSITTPDPKLFQGHHSHFAFNETLY